jgi:uncharacterized protein (DUF2141 family)
MKHILKNIPLHIVILIAGILFFSSCGQQIPPTGGPRDSLPPKLIIALPIQSAVNFKGNKIVLTFDEYINLDNPFEKLVFSPTPKKSPEAIGKLKNVTIKIKDTLEENTTYSIDFTEAIRDINENNILKDFTYTFSTGSYIDTGFIIGRVLIAETGKIDSTLIAVLQQNLDDSAVAKETPRYYTKLKGDGSFTFKFIKPGKYNLFALKDADGMKKYDQPSEMIAFLNRPIIIGIDTAFTLYAFEEEREILPKPKPTAPKVDSKKVEDKRLRLTNTLDGNKQDLLTSLTLVSEHPLKKYDTSKIRLTNKDFERTVNYTIEPDTTGKQLTFVTKWTENTEYKLIIEKDFATDTLDHKVMKTDTLSFSTKKESEYGSLDIKLEKIDSTLHPIIFLKKESKVFLKQKLEQKRYRIKMIAPGEYTIEILYDLNNNGKWDTGDYWKKRQPERLISRKQTLQIKPNWDNELSIDLSLEK